MELARIKYLNDFKSIDNKYVIYWMQASQRVSYNHALEYAITRANDLNKPLIVYLGLMDNYKDANLRHYQFMIDGLKEVSEELKVRGIKFVVLHNNPDLGAIKLASDACLMVVDRGYLKFERNIRDNVAKSINIPLIQVETNVIVPIEEVGDHEEYGAYTIRNKIKRLVSIYTNDFTISNINKKSLDIKFDNEFDLNNLDSLNIDLSVKPSLIYKGGYSEALKHLELFIANKLSKYSELKNHPELDYQSNLSPYLHFGQISPLEIYLKVINLSSESFLEELIVRRELSYNFVYYNLNYDNYLCLPKWAIDTLEEHKLDTRLYNYTLGDLESCNTHDIYWNACNKELITTGKMHGYMRMYWGKKVIEWVNDYKKAYEILLYLNNKYSIDGRDANGYAGIAWCFGKHDRPWKSRPIFGMVRYMNDAGLIKKFDIDKYVKKHL